jgi:hypothetical protein
MKNLDYIEMLIKENDIRYEQRFLAQEKSVQTALTSADKRLDLLNELRGGVATKDQLDSLAARVVRIEEQKTAWASVGSIIVGVFGVVAVIVAILVVLM